jgi:hypothetical protein
MKVTERKQPDHDYMLMNFQLLDGSSIVTRIVTATMQTCAAKMVAKSRTM